MGFGGFDVFGRLISAGYDGSNSQMQIFTQLSEPTQKIGIWIKTPRGHKHVVQDNNILLDVGVWEDQKSYSGDRKSGYAVLYRGEVLFFHQSRGIPENNGIHELYSFNPYNGVFTKKCDIIVDGESIIGRHYCVYKDKVHFFVEKSRSGLGKDVYHITWDGENFENLGLTIFDGEPQSLCVLNDNLYCLQTGRQTEFWWYYDYCYKYDGLSFEKIADIPSNIIDIRYNGISCIYKGEIHLFQKGKGLCKYDALNNMWEMVSNTFTGHNGNESICSYNNKLHIIGGWNQYSSDKHNLSHHIWNGEEWSDLSPLPFKCYNSNVLVVDGKMLAFSYVDSSTTDNGVYSFFSASSKVYQPNTVVIQKDDSANYKYMIPILSTDNVDWLSGFNDCYYYDNTGFDFDAEMYYGDGEKWVQFK